MDVLRILFIGLLMGCARAVVTRSQVATPQNVSADAWASFVQRLDCEPPARLYLVSVHYEYDVALCSCLGTREGRCSVPLSPSSLGAASSSCWESSNCNVNFRAPPVVCDSVTYSPQSANFNFLCVPATPTLSFNTMDPATGSSISAGYSRAGSDDIQVCMVETPDCSMVEVSLELVIRNEDAASSSFFSVPGHLDTLGQVGVSSTQMTLQTPFNVVLHVLSDKQLQNAYMAVQADTNVTVKCGLDTTMPPTNFCNLPILSTSPNSKVGQALTAVYSPTGQEAARDWLCVIETEECSVGTPVDVSLYVKNGAGVLDAYFSVNNGLPETDGTRTLHTPASVTLHVRSRVALAYIHAQADTKLSMTCGEEAIMIPTPACNVSIVSTPSRNRTGQALTVVHRGENTEDSTWSCMVEAADCSTGAPVNLTVYIGAGSGVDGPGTTFSVNGETTGTARLARSTPFNVTLHPSRSNVALAYVYMSASVNITLACGKDVELNCDHCASSPCPEGVVCSNVPGSFVCGCPGGHILSTDGQSCVVLSTPAVSEPQLEPPASVVGPIVGGTLGALAFIAIVIVIIVVVCRARSRKKKTLAKPVRHGHLNTAYEEANHPDEETAPEISLGQQNSTTGLLASDDSNPYDVLGQKRPPADAKQGIIYGHLRPLGSVDNEAGLVYDRAGNKPRQDVIPGITYLDTAIHGLGGKGEQNGGQNLAGSTPGLGVQVVRVSRGLPLNSSEVKFAEENGGYLEVKVKPDREKDGEVADDPGDLPPNNEKPLSGLQKVDVVKDDGSYMEVRIPGAVRPNSDRVGDLGKDLAKPSLLQPETIRLPTRDKADDDDDDDGAYEDVIINPGLQLRDKKAAGDLTKDNVNSDKQPPIPKRVEISEDDGGYLAVKVKPEHRQPADSKTQLSKPENVSAPAELGESLANSETELQGSEKLKGPAGSSVSLPNDVMDSQEVDVPAELDARPEDSETHPPEPKKAQVPADLDNLPAHTGTRLPDSVTVKVKAVDGDHQEVSVTPASLLQGDVGADSRETPAKEDLAKLVSTTAAIVEDEGNDHKEDSREASEQRDDVAVEIGAGSAETDSYDSEIEHVTYF